MGIDISIIVEETKSVADSKKICVGREQPEGRPLRPDADFLFGKYLLSFRRYVFWIPCSGVE